MGGGGVCGAKNARILGFMRLSAEYLNQETNSFLRDCLRNERQEQGVGGQPIFLVENGVCLCTQLNEGQFLLYDCQTFDNGKMHLCHFFFGLA